MNEEEILVERAKMVGCPLPMVDDRSIPQDVRFSALMTQASCFADTINGEARKRIAEVKRKWKAHANGPVWVQVGRRAFEVQELRNMLLLEGHLHRFVMRLVAEYANGGE